MTLRIEIDTSGAAFDDDGLRLQTCDILESITARLRDGAAMPSTVLEGYSWPLHDVNGNRCGTFELIGGE